MNFYDAMTILGVACISFGVGVLAVQIGYSMKYRK